MIALEDIRSLTDFQRNTKSHLKRLKATGRPEVLTVNGKAELIVQNAAAYEETLDAIRGIQRGPEIREIFHGRRQHKYRILFTVSGNEVHVLHVRHGARLALGETPPPEE